MMNEDRFNLRLLVALGVALVVHVLVLPAALMGFGVGNLDSAMTDASFQHDNTFASPMTPPKPIADEDPVGDPDDPIRTEVAWIKREAVHEHMARLTQTVQPAVQAIADPIPDAPLNPEPMPPALPSVALLPQSGGQPAAQNPEADAQDRAAPLPPTPDAPAPDAPLANRDTDAQATADEPRDTDQSTNPEDNDSQLPAEEMESPTPEQPSDNTKPAEPSETDEDGDAENENDSEDSEPKPEDSEPSDAQGTPMPPASPSEEQDPTSTPRDDSEADPTDDQPERLRLEHGNVLVGQGVRIITSRLRLGGVGSELTAIPRDTRVRIVFDNQGDVIEAEIIGEGTGYPDWDARLLQSLYRWKAEGEQIESADPHYAREFDYQFGLLNRRGE